MTKPTQLLLIAFTCLSTSQAWSAIVYSGIQDIPISTTFDGTYLNIDDGATSSSEFSGWDINFFFGGTGIYTSADFLPVKESTDWLAGVRNLAPTVAVDGTSEFFSSGIGASETHLGAGAEQFAVGTLGYIGFQFSPDAGGDLLYGWMRVTLTNNVSGGLIHDWAWEDSGAAIMVSAVPEPASSAMLLGALAVALIGYRRRI